MCTIATTVMAVMLLAQAATPAEGLAARNDDAHFHQSEEMALGHLGTAERMAAWGEILAEAKATAVTPEEMQRVAIFEKDIWGRMVEGRKRWESRREKR